MATSNNPTHTGLKVGHERGLMDRAVNRRTALDDLWIPDGAPDEFRQAVHAGYLKGVTGEPLADEDFGHA